MEIVSPIDLSGTVLLLDLRLSLKRGVLALSGSIEIQPVLPKEEPS